MSTLKWLMLLTHLCSILEHLPTTISCFLLAMDEDSIDRLSNGYGLCKISKWSGELESRGFEIRARNSIIRGNQRQIKMGLVPMLRVFNTTSTNVSTKYDCVLLKNESQWKFRMCMQTKTYLEHIYITLGSTPKGKLKRCWNTNKEGPTRWTCPTFANGEFFFVTPEHPVGIIRIPLLVHLGRCFKWPRSWCTRRSSSIDPSLRYDWFIVPTFIGPQLDKNINKCSSQCIEGRETRTRTRIFFPKRKKKKWETKWRFVHGRSLIGNQRTIRSVTCESWKMMTL
jgi:hypothetical protein